MTASPSRSFALLALALLAATASGLRAAETNVIQARQEFNMSSATLSIGDLLHFLNEDTVNHNIMIVDAALNAYDQGLQKPGQIITVTFDSTGRFQIRCSVHPTMKMSVTVH